MSAPHPAFVVFLAAFFGCASTPQATPPVAQPAPQAQSPGAVQAPSGGATVNKDAQIQKDFLDRITKYVELRDSLDGKLPKLGDEAKPEEISAHQKALYESLRKARAGAKPGDMFTPDSRALIRRLLSSAGGAGTTSRAAIQEENPGKINITINGEYPTSVPLPTVPPQVLAALPRLPDEQLEFRFLGTRLILLDGKANMIIDYMDRALP